MSIKSKNTRLSKHFSFALQNMNEILSITLLLEKRLGTTAVDKWRQKQKHAVCTVSQVLAIETKITFWLEYFTKHSQNTKYPDFTKTFSALYLDVICLDLSFCNWASFIFRHFFKRICSKQPTTGGLIILDLVIY